MAVSTNYYTNVKNPRARNITADGKYYVREEDNSITTILYLYKYIAGSYIQTSSYNFSPLLTSNIKQVIFYKDSIGNWWLLVCTMLHLWTYLDLL
jgi:hypothetical protein